MQKALQGALLIMDVWVMIGGLNIEGEDESYDFGSGAGFYVDTTKEPWTKGYNMYTYITEELPKALFSSFEELDSTRMGITGHSMGGHGALTLVRFSITEDGGIDNSADATTFVFEHSSSRTLANTSPAPHLRPSPIPAIARGARKLSKAILARITSKSGLSTTQQN